MRSFDSDIVDVEQCLVRFLDLFPQHDLSRQIDKVDFQNLADERKTSGSPQVAFDHFDRIPFGKKLYVERSGYL